MTRDNDESTSCNSKAIDIGDLFIDRCYFAIRTSARLLTVLITFVILWGTLDVIWVIYQRMAKHPHYLLEINDTLDILGAFLAVLIAIVVFENIVMYLKKREIQARAVVAIALMAAARKVIVFDFKDISADYVWATGGVILALGLAYWLLTVKPGNSRPNSVEVVE